MLFDLFSNKDKPAIKILGASGGKSKHRGLSSVQVSSHTVIDAGNLIEGLGGNLASIEHIFITHMHLDHIVEIPFLIDTIYDIQQKPLKIYARQENLDSLKKHIFNWEIWPDFTTINMKKYDQPCIELIPIELNKPIEINDVILTPIENNHTPTSNGYLIEKENSAILYTSDTYCCDSIWETLNNNSSISSVILDVSFPSKLDELALNSKHLTPKLLKEELKKLQRDDITVYINHLKPFYESELIDEIENYQLLLNKGKILHSNNIIYF